MMNFSEIFSTKSGRKRRRVGRGTGSGHGKTSGRGHNGQNSRSGGGTRPGFEGGQMPLTQRIPKQRGFRSRRVNETVSLRSLENLKEGTVVTKDILLKEGIVKNPNAKLKIVGSTGLKKKLTTSIKATKAASKLISIVATKEKTSETKDKKQDK